ncbi:MULTISPECIES: DUF3080 family protein [unclassified Shewanella]|uniref:DUF3080 family protein n=1 Tax=unclassified Shewanella TaxID=196818 RepID=UPI0012FF40E3|nr:MULTISPECIES: DUF3080 family protein [unclassified Shewanella]
MLKTVGYLAIIALLLSVVLQRPVKDADFLWNNYQKRLSTVLGHEIKLQPPYFKRFNSALKEAPEKKQTISVLDSFKLNKCHLGQLIANQNSILGKVALSSQQLIYHVKFIQLAPACIKALSIEHPMLANQLREELIRKKQRAYAQFNTFINSEKTIAALLFSSHESLEFDATLKGINPLENALTRLLIVKTAIKQQRWEDADIDELEKHLSLLHQHSFLKKYMRSLVINMHQLKMTNDFLEQYSNLVQCQTGRSNQKLPILKNVFNKYYLADIQAYLSRMNSVHFRLNKLLIALFEDTQYQQLIEHYFSDDPTALPATLILEIKRHVKWWQAVQNNCGSLRPE